MKEDRRKLMGDMIARRQHMTMEALCAHFGVSMNTIRADVAYLVKTGAAEKVYGGVRALDQRQVPLFASRAMLHPDQKRRIAARAETLIEDGDIIFLDAGTTTMHMMECLSPGKHVTIVTGNLSVIGKAGEFENVQLIVLPGTLNRRTNSVADGGTLEFLQRYQFNKAFMGVSGISEDGRLNVSTYIEFEIKRNAMAGSKECYLLADSAKFGATGLMSYGTLEDMTALITDEGCPDFARDHCAAAGLPIFWA